MVIAHNGEGSATITSTEKVTFPNNKVTDTFYYYGDLVVTSEVQSYDLTLTRAVAMFRLVLTDEEIPSTVTKFKFYYTGGSSTFSPSAGYGCVNSKQTEIRAVADGVTTFDIYTLPHTEEDVLTKLTVTALDANDNTVKERVFENVPVTRNQITLGQRERLYVLISINFESRGSPPRLSLAIDVPISIPDARYPL